MCQSNAQLYFDLVAVMRVSAEPLHTLEPLSCVQEIAPDARCVADHIIRTFVDHGHIANPT